MFKRFPAVLIFTGLSLPHAAAVQASGIYTCVDARGNKLTSDRPIAACVDREQRQLNSSGVTKRVVGPSQTAAEAAAAKEREQQAEEERKKAVASKKAQAVLLQRYPNATSHQAAREKAAEEVFVRLREGYEKLASLKTAHQKLAQEMEFYKKSPDNAPATLRNQWQASLDSQKSAETYIEKQRQELLAVHKRFDAELAELQSLWKTAP
ncbi:MAG: DUF4124 domain-containing protein [Brachymonas sp.]|nr:DUF4124 domain-containing protein [Brachymonas sp.]